MRDIGQRVGNLRLAERSARPVGKPVRLVQRVARYALHQLVVGDRVAIAENHGGNLRVDDWMGDLLRQVPDNFNVLASGVEYLDDLFVRHQLEKGGEIDIVG